ncbi:hypothetical protein [Pseudomonas graminis]
MSHCAHSHPEPIIIEDEPTTQVSTLVEQLAMADAKQSTKIIDKIDSIRRENPENTDILLMYTNSLLGEKRYKEGLKSLSALYEKKPTRSYLLAQCMLKERLGNIDKSCYKEVVKISEENNLIDSDYLTALFFSDAEKFSAAQQELIKTKEFNESDLLVYTRNQKEILLEFFP